MRTCKVAFVTTVICFCLLASSYGADVAKIGIVDFQRILKTSSAGKKATAEINKRGKKIEADLKKRGEEIEATKNKLEREALVMSREMREEKEREIRININDFKSLQKRYVAEFKEREKRLVARIQEEILDIIAEMGKKEGFLLILEKREAGVMYSPNAIDITDRLIQKYNASFARKAEKDKKTQKK
ncbi:MAG: OmpH family outer membrane protein [Deltaproteobacteria bacterium]|nr:OmpH family outer membrane protein [Deltaproteobacteria bacterium]MBW2014959.1 OmpH family outer membrane protein [Deltaproteobacteria bacterium]MBW2090293.1 OmpH family outer membrane protein [Deltaproteobacteria bacterium]